MINILIYFSIGLLIDTLGTLDMIAVQKDQAYRSASISFIGTMLDCLIFYNIVISPDFVLGIFSYALGGAVGTVLTMRHKSILLFFVKGLPVQADGTEVKNKTAETVKSN